jgi:hypothetical protein
MFKERAKIKASAGVMQDFKIQTFKREIMKILTRR